MQVDYQNQNQHSTSNDQHYLVEDENKRLRCVCELCTCGNWINYSGNHKCPRPRIKGTFTTSYTDHYKDIKIGSSPAPKQDYRYEPRHYNPEALRTNYQETYVPMQLNYGV